MTTERRSAEPTYAVDVWREVVEVTGSNYVSILYYFPPISHGSNPVKRSVVIPAENWVDISEAQRLKNESIAVGSAIYGEELLIISSSSNESDELDVGYFRDVILPHITHQPILPGMENVEKKSSKISEMFKYDDGQLLLIDFECPSDPVNTKRIIEIMGKSRFDSWYLLDSGGGYHAIIKDAGFSVPQLIQTYGELISLFSQEAAGYKDHIFQSYAKDLFEGAELLDIYGGHVMMKDEEKIKKACKDILAQVGHIGEPNEEGKLTFIIDLRHIAYTVLDVLSFYDGNDERYGALRITKGKGYPVPPILIAESEEGSVTQYVLESDPFGRIQERLPGF